VNLGGFLFYINLCKFLKRFLGKTFVDSDFCCNFAAEIESKTTKRQNSLCVES